MGDLWYETSMGNGPKRIAHVGTGPEAIQAMSDQEFTWA